MDNRQKRPLTKTEKTIRRFKRMRKNRKARFLGTMINPSRFHVSQLKFLLILVPMLTVTLLPLIFIVSHAFKPLDELYAYPPRIFASRFTLDNFTNLFTIASQTGVPFSRYFFNSLVSSAFVIFLSILIGSLAAYSFSFLKYKGKETMFMINQIAIMIVPVKSMPRRCRSLRATMAPEIEAIWVGTMSTAAPNAEYP